MQLLGFVAGFALPAPAAPPACNEPFRVVVSEQMSGIDQPIARVLDGPVAYCAAWDQIYGNQLPPPPCDPTVIAWQQEFAVLVALGWRPDGCYSMSVACVHRTANDAIGVGVIEQQPGQNCACPDVIVNPVSIVAVARPYTQVRFEGIVRELDCGP